MSLIFGFIHYARASVSDNPEIAVKALTAFAALKGGTATYQGLFAGHGKFGKRRRITSQTLEQLRVDLLGGIYSDCIAYRGPRHAESAVLSFDCGLGERRGEFPVSVSCIGQVDDKEKLPELLEFSFDLWEHFRPAYGMSAFASDWSAVSAELTAIPHVFWRGPKDANNEARLLGIQRLHAAFGVHARDAAWGNYLGGPLVERLGGSGAASREAPVAVIRELRDGGLYLQAATDPLLLENDGYTSSLATLNEYLGRIRAAKTRDASGWSSPAP